jgi:hypothetical protein
MNEIRSLRTAQFPIEISKIFFLFIFFFFFLPNQKKKMQHRPGTRDSISNAIKEASNAADRVIQEVGHSYSKANAKWSSTFGLNIVDVLLEGNFLKPSTRFSFLLL